MVRVRARLAISQSTSSRLFIEELNNSAFDSFLPTIPLRIDASNVEELICNAMMLMLIAVTNITAPMISGSRIINFILNSFFYE